MDTQSPSQFTTFLGGALAKASQLVFTFVLVILQADQQDMNKRQRGAILSRPSVCVVAGT